MAVDIRILLNNMTRYFCISLIVLSALGDFGNGEYVDNFEKEGDISLWVESSDTINEKGKSKATLTLLESGSFKRAILFTLLDPQEGGAGFAGIKKEVQMDITENQNISVNLKSQGQYNGYEFCLRDRGVSGITVPAFCQFFKAPSEFETITFPIDEFKPHFEGSLLTNHTALDKSNVTQLILITYGGVRLPKDLQQTGVAALEINWIKIS